MQPETAHPITASILFMCAPPFRGRTLALPQLIDVFRTDTACRGGRRCPALCQPGREEAGGGEATQPVVFVFVFPRVVAGHSAPGLEMAISFPAMFVVFVVTFSAPWWVARRNRRHQEEIDCWRQWMNEQHL